MGLGHLRRNLLIAQSLSGSPFHVTILMIAGARQAGSLTMPAGADCLTLPSFCKHTNGDYQPLKLDISLEELVILRAKSIKSALEAYEPDVLIVDKVPRGVARELEPALEYLRARGATRTVLGLREILDDPQVAQQEWQASESDQAIHDYYDAIWVYGDPAVYDLAREYDLSDHVTRKLHYTGYLGQHLRLQFCEAGTSLLATMPSKRMVLCLVGGGQDGDRLAETFAQSDLPEDSTGVILTGPFMPAETIERLRGWAETRPSLRVLDFIPEPAPFISRADRVIAMGGYNTICEVLSFEKRALIVPRVKPRREQLIRAERMRDLGLIDMLHPDELSSQAIKEWLASDLQPLPPARDKIDLDGLKRLPLLLADLLGSSDSLLGEKLLSRDQSDEKLLSARKETLVL